MKLIKSEQITVFIKFRGKTMPKSETKYTFDDNGAVLTFAANPKKAWTFTLYNEESNDKGLASAQAIINKHVRMLQDIALQHSLTGDLD